MMLVNSRPIAVEKISIELKNRKGSKVKRCLIECGVPQASEEDALAMNVSEPGKNVNLRIESISRSMVGNIPDLLIDLLESRGLRVLRRSAHQARD
jgi:hypothetical protein